MRNRLPMERFYSVAVIECKLAAGVSILRTNATIFAPGGYYGHLAIETDACHSAHNH
jgi:hypothetical protein